MNFLERIVAQLKDAGDRIVVAESAAASPHANADAAAGSATGAQLLAAIATARSFFRGQSLRRGERCALIANNSVRWTALDLAIVAEGLIAVPLYARQAPPELVAMMRDAQVSMICCGDASLREAVAAAWPEAPRIVLFDEVFSAETNSVLAAATIPLSADDPIAILYTSGTSGEAKGVVLTVGNLDHMLACTTARLNRLMGKQGGTESVFHYLPCCFAGSWILLLSCLSRNSALTFSTDLTKLPDEIRAAAPNYFLNVPTLLERMRAAIEENIRKRGGQIAKLFDRAQGAWSRVNTKTPRPWDTLWLGLAGLFIFPAIRKRLGPNLRALICGSAPLARETQLFFLMLGIPVLQVYGLTETTAICTMDDPGHVESGRVGPAIPGVEMKAGENDEILVRGPNVFRGYWNRPTETANVLRDGWFHSGDQGDVNENGNWRITGRLKNLIILNSGHNIAPEPLEEALLHTVHGAQQVILVGNGRGFLSAIITGDVVRATAEAQIERLNAQLPHYRKIRMFRVEPQPFTIESGLLTANGKLKRDIITARFAREIDHMYAQVHEQVSH